MDKKIKKEWIKELRSGNRKQASGSLCVSVGGETGYCCLGVLYDITEDDEWTGKDRQTYTNPLSRKLSNPFWPEKITITEWSPSKAASTSAYKSAYLPPKIREKIGLTKKQQSELAEMNDTGKSFKEIADWIEENL